MAAIHRNIGCEIYVAGRGDVKFFLETCGTSGNPWRRGWDGDPLVAGRRAGGAADASGQAGFWDVQDRLRDLLAQGDLLEKLSTTVDFELFRADLTAALAADDRRKGGRPAFDPVLKFRMLLLQALHGLSLVQTEYLVADRLAGCASAPWPRRCGAGRQHAVGIPQGVDRHRRAGEAVRPAGRNHHRRGVSADGWPDRGRDAGSGTSPAQQRG
jgi:hypothetical protein